MIAMQYSFSLPADYDMEIIHQRIASKGHLMDNFPHLVFKAFLSAGAGQTDIPSLENLYAPFYLWENSSGLNAFLCSPGFRALTRDFGWPIIKSWVVWDHMLHTSVEDARCATREVTSLPPHTDLDQQQALETRLAQTRMEQQGALGTVAGFEPTTWTVVRFTLWDSSSGLPVAPLTQAYRVGYLAQTQPAQTQPA